MKQAPFTDVSEVIHHKHAARSIFCEQELFDGRGMGGIANVDNAKSAVIHNVNETILGSDILGFRQQGRSLDQKLGLSGIGCIPNHPPTISQRSQQMMAGKGVVERFGDRHLPQIDRLIGVADIYDGDFPIAIGDINAVFFCPDDLTPVCVHMTA